MVSNMLPVIWILMSFSLSGIFASGWSVHVPVEPVYAHLGSSIVLPCTYDYPEDSDQKTPRKVLSEMWCLNQSHCITPRYLYHSAGIFPEPSYQKRVKFLGQTGTKDCSLKISDLKSEDSGVYVFRFITDHLMDKLPGQKGVTLLVISGKTSSFTIGIVFGVFFIFLITVILICIQCKARRAM
ncbi:hyaluronan and proteoglycan link protein 3 [Triplophysa dalaica]|uniref:hyaluronan and proteoglycan link protein 3 n=1 Tax=Triplophysa dalaica TaxID=1582913 RepID=UPI0024DFC76F|nr:hyaluronan and proteoglycan link protein 3 [Triplophysa dalaica]